MAKHRNLTALSRCWYDQQQQPNAGPSDAPAATGPAPSAAGSSSTTATPPTSSMMMDVEAARNRKRKHKSPVVSVPVHNRFAVLETDDDRSAADDNNEADSDGKNVKKMFKTPEPVNTTAGATNSRLDEDDDADTWSIASSQMSLVSEPTDQPNTSPTSSLHNKTQTRKFIYDKTNESQWKLNIHNNPTTVVIADSNMRSARNIPDGWEVHAYPGAYLLHVANLLQSTKFPESVKNIIVSAGINNRSWDYARSCKHDLLSVCTKAKQLGNKVHFLGISSSGLPAHIAANVRMMNTDAEAHLNKRFIQPLQPDQVTIVSLDPQKIHHDRTTVDKIINSIKCHLN